MDLALTELDLEGMVTPEQAALLRSDDHVEQWLSALQQLKKEAEIRLASLRADMLAKEQECRRRGPTGKGEWFSYKAKQQQKVVRETVQIARIERGLREAKPLVKALHRRTSLAATTDFRLDLLRGLVEAIAPLASLDHALPTTAHDDGHVAAYMSVRLKVGDIRAARKAWLDGQSFLGEMGQRASLAGSPTIPE